MKSSFNKQLKEYEKGLTRHIMATRFNNFTWKENADFIKKHSPHIGCIYPSPEINSKAIPADRILFILEMNNEQNKIMGVGIVRNRISQNKYFVYSNENYNRYTYIGNMRIDRSEMDEMEENIMKVFDILCFKGSKHIKRLQGITSFPTDMLYKCKSVMDLVEFVGDMFKKRMKE